jgi:hypothetical protein
MSEPIKCPRCRRSFGGHFTWRRAHPNKRCRSIVGLRGIGLHRNGGGVWRRPGPTDPMQLRFPLFGRGRPRKRVPQYSLGTAERRSPVSGTRGPRRHETSQLRLWPVAA